MEYLEIAPDERLDFYERVRFITLIVIDEQHKEAEAKRKKK